MAQRLKNLFHFRKSGLVPKSNAGGGFRRSHSLRMDKIKRTFSFRKKKDHVPESSKPHQWQEDEKKVRDGSCSFQVRYLGCVEVYESRGMQVCEEAVKALKQNKAKHQRAVLYVSGDALRVVDEIRKGLIVDQTIEKVSFCAPDRGHDKGFAYICRDGTTRRWMCHGFMAVKETVSGERLSHAVGCAFAICLERKQKRDKESGVTVTFNEDKTSFTRTGSFRQTTMTERLADPQSAIIAEPVPSVNLNMNAAVERPHATEGMMQKMGSFRGFPKLQNASSPFKRQMSLPVRGHKAAAQFELEGYRGAHNGPGGDVRPPSPIREEISPTKENGDPIADMCQQLSAGLSEMSTNGNDPNQQHQHSAMIHHQQQQQQNHWQQPASTQQNTNHFQATFPTQIPASGTTNSTALPIRQSNPWGSPEKHQQITNQPVAPGSAPASGGGTFWLNSSPARTGQPPQPAQQTIPSSSDRLYTNLVPFNQPEPTVPAPAVSAHRAPHLSAQVRSHSLDSGNDFAPQPVNPRAPTLREMSQTQRNWQSVSAAQVPLDPFDVAWANRPLNQAQQIQTSQAVPVPPRASTNPFATGNAVKAFEVKL